jgi:hypothetical protein
MDRRRRQLLTHATLGTLALGASAVRAQALPFEVASEWPQARLVGRGQLRFVGLRIYDARLWSPARPTADDWASQPLALELQYARSLEGAQIAERSLQEMRRQGPIDQAAADRWLATMKITFPDVRDGDRVTGIYRPGVAARFFHNGSVRGEWPDPAKAQRFFGIWLSPQTSEPALREALFGGRA